MGVARQAVCVRTGMVHTRLLLAWLFILIRAGSSEPAASSPGAVAGFASACISGLRASTGRGTGQEATAVLAR